VVYNHVFCQQECRFHVLLVKQAQYLCQEIIVLKLDFEKAFDKLKHEAILLLVVQHLGFGETDIHFSCGTSSVFLNRGPGKTFHCRKEARQPFTINDE
jgi:hypothetical protein